MRAKEMARREDVKYNKFCIKNQYKHILTIILLKNVQGGIHMGSISVQNKNIKFCFINPSSNEKLEELLKIVIVEKLNQNKSTEQDQLNKFILIKN